MCLLGEILQDLIMGRVASATKPGEEETKIWSIRHINSLPQEVLFSVFKFLSFADLRRVLLVCQHWREVGEDPVLWKKLKLVVEKPVMLGSVLSIPRLACVEHLEVNGYGYSGSPAVIDADNAEFILKSKVSKLTLKHCDVSKVTSEDLDKLINNLVSLVLWQTVLNKVQISGIFHSVMKSQRLKELDIGYSYIDLANIDPEILAASLNRVKKVNLGHTKLSANQLNTLFKYISSETMIKNLDIGYRDLGGIQTEILKSALKNLEKANICATKLITTPYILSYKYLAKSCPV
eukprot:TRINITY_DN57272_c0_g1_i1.p1 TRINITY_DN57272_c0_g1~~TRINITY_DN57272_c0_g1_i1.p1  ORF type:complete len:292 (-),score=62.66 TRINITY_DN57272_c0_g1_i1:92-967(-)